jgi:hypothetical protein
MAATIDWEGLARQLGTLDADGESGGSDVALRAIELLLGEECLRAAVDHYVARRPGSELARHVLWQLQPWSAMQRCYELSRSGADVDTRCAAVELLRVVADRRALPWVEDFLSDPHPGIQGLGAGVLDQLLWSGRVGPDECADLLRRLGEHPNEKVRETAAFIRSYLRRREGGSTDDPGADW